MPEMPLATGGHRTDVARTGLCFKAADDEDCRRREAVALHDYVNALVSEAPALTECQRARLALLLNQSVRAQ
jgi:hypothetical protein